MKYNGERTDGHATAQRDRMAKRHVGKQTRLSRSAHNTYSRRFTATRQKHATPGITLQSTPPRLHGVFAPPIFLSWQRRHRAKAVEQDTAPPLRPTRSPVATLHPPPVPTHRPPAPQIKRRSPPRRPLGRRRCDSASRFPRRARQPSPRLGASPHHASSRPHALVAITPTRPGSCTRSCHPARAAPCRRRPPPAHAKACTPEASIHVRPPGP